jgi:hypothetical protein
MAVYLVRFFKCFIRNICKMQNKIFKIEIEKTCKILSAMTYDVLCHMAMRNTMLANRYGYIYTALVEALRD